MTTRATNGTTLDDGRGAAALERLLSSDRPVYRRLWAYYKNPMRVCRLSGASGSERPYRQGQEWGLPRRGQEGGRPPGIPGVRRGGEPFATDGVHGDIARKEVVIENDIGWRIDTM